MNSIIPNSNKKVCVLGATGYVGGRLVSKLLEEGFSVIATGRSQQKLKSRQWADDPRVQLVDVDVNNQDDLRRALEGVDVVYYLVHSMNPQHNDFAEADRRAAENMASISAECGVRRIIYLGGLGEDSPDLSEHLRSRHEVSEILKKGTVSVTELRAAMIIGSGSASFEILRYLVEHLPAMITPRWVKTPNQPIAIRNVIGYLYGCLVNDETKGETYDIGGKEVLSYLELMRIYAEVAGLPKRFVIPVPVLTPRLSSLWIHLVTPVPSYIARPLAEGLRNPVVCQDQRIQDIIPQDLLNCREAISKALNLLNNNGVVTHWTDAGEIPEYASVQSGDPVWAGGTVLKDFRKQVIKASRSDVWDVVSKIGGDTGWYHGSWLWKLRGFLDRIVGGVGLSRGRKNAVTIAVGDILDFWRVISVEDNDHLKLLAEMKLPGQGRLEFRIVEISSNECELFQEASFQPKGLSGLLYWYAVTPLHHYVFGGMIKKIGKLAEKR